MRLLGVKKGLAIGFATGTAVSFFEAFYMLTDKVYVPLSYPLSLLCYNLCVWMVYGAVVGILKQYGKKQQVLSRLSEHNQWIVCFVIPFLAIYGLIGRISFLEWSLLASVFDYHLSFLWAALMICYSLRCSKRIACSSDAVHMTIILEIVMIITIFSICSNIAHIQLFKQVYVWLFSREITQETHQNFSWYLFLLYLLFVIFAGILYIKLLFSLKTRIKKRI